MRRLQNSLDTAAWGIQISAAARSEETIQSLTSVLSGTLEYSGLRLFWSDEEPDRTGFVMNQEEVLPLLFFPAEEFCGFAFKENEEFSLVSENIRGEALSLEQFALLSDLLCQKEAEKKGSSDPQTKKNTRIDRQEDE